MTPPDDRILCDLFDGVAGSYAVAIAHDLGVFRVLQEGPRTAGELCAVLTLAPRRMEILLILCVAARLLRVEDGRYALTDVAGAYLVESSPTYAGALFELWSRPDAPFTFEKFRRAVLDDAPHPMGERPWIEQHRRDAATARDFTRVMHGHSMAPATAWPEHVDLGGHARLLDVGGGSGAHAIGAVRRWPHLEAIVLDLPSVCGAAGEYIARSGHGDRIRTRAGDMWRDLYPDADVHFYSDVFHDWTPEECAVLARRSFEQLPAGGCIIVHEMLYDHDKRGPFTVAASSMAMLAWCGGQQFSGPELVALLRDAGFRDLRVTPTFGYWSIVTGTKR